MSTLTYHIAQVSLIVLLSTSFMADAQQTSGSDRTEISTSLQGPTKPVTAQTFATQAAIIGKAEIELGQLAMRNGQDASVKDYGQRMVKDHTAADAQLKTIAGKENLALPTELDAEHRAVRQKLSSLTGADFDVAYRAEMAKGHDRAVALFEAASQTPTLPEELRQFAASTLPTLQQHQEKAHSLGEDDHSAHR
ncbi:MAG: DUF4142 domain-containing protein [Povalibacter sp.]